MDKTPDQERLKTEAAPSAFRFLKNLIIGRRLNPEDRSVFRHISLIAFFAWVGLGADGLSSSCYGPAEAFITLGRHTFLAIFVGIGTALTIFVISESYSQIIELFPTGGGGYLVSSKLLSPTVGMISGCALLIDYVLTITLSIASGADAFFSFLPAGWYAWRLPFAALGVLLLSVLNLRGVKESIAVLMPIFLVFVITHGFAILYALGAHVPDLSALAERTVSEIGASRSELGLLGMFVLIMRAYSMGAGTYTGIEAVSNGLPILREPKVETGKRTMTYMAVSLSVTVLGLIIGYMLYGVKLLPGKTLNAALLAQLSAHWGSHLAYTFILVTLLSEAAILLVAAQTGFIDGPRVLANMAQDRWFPTRFAMLSDRLVTQNGVLLMGGAALALMIVSRGSVGLLLVLYSINVFITFVLSQLGMVRHWWQERGKVPHWRRRLLINGLGLVLCGFILISIVLAKFSSGGWATLLITGFLIAAAYLIKRHYTQVGKMIAQLDSLMEAAAESPEMSAGHPDHGSPPFDPEGKTAVVLVNGFNGLGLHTLLNINRIFTGVFKNFIFLQVGMIDSGVFKGGDQVEALKNRAHSEINRYVDYMRRNGFFAQGLVGLGTDVVHEIMKLSDEARKEYPQAIFFGGQIVFPRDTFITRFLHNYVVFAVQKQLYLNGIPFVIVPVRVNS